MFLEDSQENSSGFEVEASADEGGTKEERPSYLPGQPEDGVEEDTRSLSDRIGNPDHKWYVIHAMSGHEEKVRESILSRREYEGLTDDISEVLIPTENVSMVKGGKKRIRTRKFFPGYVLVKMDVTDDVWYFIRNTNGVLGFVGSSGGKPIALREDEINEILGQLEEKKEKVKPKVLYDVGESLKVTDGPFVNFNGIVEETYPEKGKLKIMVSIFGRATPVELEYWQVERA